MDYEKSGKDRRELGEKMIYAQLRLASMEVKIRSSDFRTLTRSRALPEPTNLTDLLWHAAGALFENTLLRDLLPVRLLGVGATQLTRETETQNDLFDDGLRERRTVDSIRGEFGGAAIQRGSLLDLSGDGA